jgi:DNA-binding GntR family transcriptional regulator
MATTPRSLQCEHGRRRQAIVESVLREVFQGRLKAGEHLVTQDLAHQFGVSHTPIREALIFLSGIGIIDLVPNRGAIVRRVAARDIREVCQVRRALECQAVRSACGKIEAGELESLAEEFRRLKSIRVPRQETVTRARALDSRLHDLIAAQCGNTFLAHELGRLKTLFRAFRDVAWEHQEARQDLKRVGVEAREHLEIVERLLAGDRRGASLAMARHIISGGKYWSRAVSRLILAPRHESSFFPPKG